MNKRQPGVALANKAENYLLYKQDRTPRGELQTRMMHAYISFLALDSEKWMLSKNPRRELKRGSINDLKCSKRKSPSKIG